MNKYATRAAIDKMARAKRISVSMFISHYQPDLRVTVKDYETNREIVVIVDPDDYKEREEVVAAMETVFRTIREAGPIVWNDILERYHDKKVGLAAKLPEMPEFLKDK